MHHSNRNLVTSSCFVKVCVADTNENTNKFKILLQSSDDTVISCNAAPTSKYIISYTLLCSQKTDWVRLKLLESWSHFISCFFNDPPLQKHFIRSEPVFQGKQHMLVSIFSLFFFILLVNTLTLLFGALLCRSSRIKGHHNVLRFFRSCSFPE